MDNLRKILILLYRQYTIQLWIMISSCSTDTCSRVWVSCYSIDFDVDHAAGLAEHSLLG